MNISGFELGEETVSFLKEREEKGFTAPYPQLTMELARERTTAVCNYFGGDFPFDGDISELKVPSDEVQEGIPVTVYKPRDLPEKPVICVYFHGGGWTVGCRENYDPLCRKISSSAKCLVVNVEYRLAPENKFPACNNDAKCVVQWILQNKTSVGGHTDSAVGVGGDSAGGSISAIVCYEVTGIAFQILIYPKIDVRLDRLSYKQFEKDPVIPRPLLIWFFEQWLTKDDYDNVRINSLNRTADGKLPPALFLVAECDPLRDDSYDYEKKLKALGVETEFVLVKGACHGYFGFIGHFKKSCEQSINAVVTFIQRFA